MVKYPIGILSMYIFIAVTIMLLGYGLISGSNSVELILKFSPIVLITYAVEVVLFKKMFNNKNYKLKFSGLSITIILIIIVSSTCLLILNQLMIGAYSVEVIGEVISYKTKVMRLLQSVFYI